MPELQNTPFVDPSNPNNTTVESKWFTLGNYKLDKLSFLQFGSLVALVTMCWLYKGSVDTVADNWKTLYYQKCDELKDEKKQSKEYLKALGVKEATDTIKNYQ